MLRYLVLIIALACSVIAKKIDDKKKDEDELNILLKLGFTES